MARLRHRRKALEWQRWRRGMTALSLPPSMRPLAAEFVGTFALVFAGIGAIVIDAETVGGVGPLLTACIAMSRPRDLRRDDLIYCQWKAKTKHRIAPDRAPVYE